MAFAGLFFVAKFASRCAVVAMSNCFVYSSARLFNRLPALCAHAGPGGLVRCHRTGYQFVAFLQFAFENLGRLRDSVVGDAGADSNWLESGIRMQFPQVRNINPRGSYWLAISSASLARRMRAILLGRSAASRSVAGKLCTGVIVQSILLQQRVDFLRLQIRFVAQCPLPHPPHVPFLPTRN